MRVTMRVVSLGLALAGCCFGGGSRHIDVDLPQIPPAPPPDPSMNALWACLEESVVAQRCPAPLTQIPGAEFDVGLTYRTQDLDAWRTPGVITAYVGETTTTEIARGNTGDTSDDAPPRPGETLTWNEHLTVHAPATGWPTDRMVYFQLRDGRGRVAAATSVQFTGPQVAPPPRRALGILNVCSDATVAGLPDDVFCPVNQDTVPHGHGMLYTSYTSDSAPLWTDGATLVLERRDRRGSWVEESSLALAPVVLPPGEEETAETSYSLDQRLFTRHSHWRARFVVRDVTVSEREFDVE